MVVYMYVGGLGSCYRTWLMHGSTLLFPIPIKNDNNAILCRTHMSCMTCTHIERVCMYIQCMWGSPIVSVFVDNSSFPLLH